MILLGSYFTLAIATYIDLLVSEKTTLTLKSASPTKNRKKLSNDIDKIERLQKFSIIWPYVIYVLINEK
jgi:hypothetical protein